MVLLPRTYVSYCASNGLFFFDADERRFQGKTLEQMDEIFRSNTAHEDNLIKAEIQAAIMDVSPIENTASVFKSGEKLGDKDIQQEWVETV